MDTSAAKTPKGQEQLAATRETDGALGVGEQAVVADLDEAFGVDVLQEATQELVGIER